MKRHLNLRGVVPGTRRQVLVATLGGLGGLAGTPTSAAANSGCDAIQRLLARIDDERRTTAAWAASIGTAQTAHLESRLTDLENATKSARASVDGRSKEAFVAAANAAGSAAFVVVGVGLSSVAGASAGVFAASVFFLQGMLVMQAGTAPRSVSGLEVAQDVSLDRLGNILSVAGDRAYAMSTSSARLLGYAGNVAGFTTACFATVKAAQAWRSLSEARADLDSLERRLRELRESLAALRAANTLQAFRQNCLEALGAEAVPAAQRLCPLILPRRN